MLWSDLLVRVREHDGARCQDQSGQQFRSLQHRAQRLRDMMLNSDYLHRIAVWADWYGRSHVTVLASTLADFETSTCSVLDVLDALARSPRLWKLQKETMCNQKISLKYYIK